MRLLHVCKGALAFALVAVHPSSSLSQSPELNKEILAFIKDRSDPILDKYPEFLPPFVAPSAFNIKLTIGDLTDRSKSFSESKIKPIAEASTKFIRRELDQMGILQKIADVEDEMKRHDVTLPGTATVACKLFTSEPNAICDAAQKTAVDNIGKNITLSSTLRDLETSYWQSVHLKQAVWSELIHPLLDQTFYGTGQPSISVDFDECWCGDGKIDIVALKNNSDAEMENVIIRTDVFDADKRHSAYAWHVVDKWPPGSVMHAAYVGSSGYIRPRTVPIVSSVAISMWSERTSKLKLDYAYKGDEKKKDLKRHMSDAGVFQVRYLPFEEGMLFNAERGLSISLNKSIPIEHKVFVNFELDGGRSVLLSKHSNGWSQGETLEFRHKDVVSDPRSISASIVFDEGGSEYRHPLGVWRLN